MGWELRRRPGERNQRPFEGRTELTRRIRPRIIARYDGNSENEGSIPGLLRKITTLGQEARVDLGQHALVNAAEWLIGLGRLVDRDFAKGWQPSAEDHPKLGLQRRHGNMPEHGIRSTYSQCPFELHMHDEQGVISTGSAFFFGIDDEWFLISSVPTFGLLISVKY